MFHFEQANIENSNSDDWLTICVTYTNLVLSPDPIRFYWGLPWAKARELMGCTSELQNTCEFWQKKGVQDLDTWIAMYSELRKWVTPR